MKFIFGLIIGLLLAGAIPVVLIYNGSLNMCATQMPSMMEKRLGSMSWENWVHKNAPITKNPLANDQFALKAGLDHYAENCFVCHAAPGMEKSEISRGLNPPAPILNDIADFTDAELFYIIKNGIRMTGMPAFGPTHKDGEIWKIVLFVRHLPNLTDQERQVLDGKSADEEHHHD